MNLSNLFIMASNLVLILLMREKRFLPYLLIYPVAYFLLWIYQEIHFVKHFNVPFSVLSFSRSVLLSSVGTGFFLMIGNFSSVFFVSLDRWFVKFLLTEIDFARYSFAVSMENMLSIAVTPFSVILYNYFCRNKSEESVRDVTGFMLIYATAVMVLLFPVRLIVEMFLPDYAKSFHVMILLFCAQTFFIIIRSVYVNLYKARKMQNAYFVRMAAALISGVVFNVLFYLLLRTVEAMAIGTLCSALLWFLLCQGSFADARLNSRQWGYFVVVLCGFVLIASSLNAIAGMILYVCLVAAGGFLFVRNDFLAVFRRLKHFLGSATPE